MIEIIDCVQGEAAWFKARLGVPTASCFAQVLAKGEGKTRRSYMCRLAGEIITGVPAETYKSAAMVRGTEMEDEARSYYAFMEGVDPQRVGFVRNGAIGCSPDSLIGNNGVLEIKTQQPDLLVETILADKFPVTHKAQCQGNLLVLEREFIDICVYWPGMPRFVKRATRDEPYIATLRSELSRFNDELNEMVVSLRRYGSLQEAAA